MADRADRDAVGRGPVSRGMTFLKGATIVPSRRSSRWHCCTCSCCDAPRLALAMS